MIQRLEQQGRIMVESLLIETKNLTKSYGPHVALDDLNLSIPHGATGLLGPNGAGKSTFLKTMLGLIQVTSGEGSILGHDIRTEGEQIRSKIGYMPEYDALNPKMDAIYQVKYSGELLGMNPNIALSRAHQALEYVGLGEQRYRTVETFSTGMKQATKLACALVHDPDLIIAEMEYEQSKKDTSIARSELAPTAKLSLEKSYSEDLNSTYDEKEKETLKATVTWPFFSGGKNIASLNKNKNIENQSRLILDSQIKQNQTQEMRC